ncbi:192_t:CDS:2 [Dentiscutata erythropus]|uniref:192_t:CDS:1 n=1 Tax=Dentiscutata erythropus TaxID=1348616 RepID=A0A9N9G116_9GLOM|nr:192_t:CDS:2 [Dentiscutata erythropus]
MAIIVTISVFSHIKSEDYIEITVRLATHAILGQCNVAIKSIESSSYNISNESKTSEIFREPIALIVSAISCQNDLIKSNVLKCYGLKLPFSNELHDDIYLSVAICNGERPQANGNVVIPKCYKELMVKCWDNNPSNRPNINELYEILRGWYLAGINDNQFKDANNSKNNNVKTFNPLKQPPWNSEFISTMHITDEIPEQTNTRNGMIATKCAYVKPGMDASVDYIQSFESLKLL